MYVLVNIYHLGFCFVIWNDYFYIYLFIFLFNFHLQWVLHDWADEACINILKKCREAVPVDTGKVIIVDAVLDEDDEEPRDELSGARLLLDMTIMIGTANGKERTAKEWAKLIEAAGFTRHTINHIKATIESVIEAYP